MPLSTSLVSTSLSICFAASVVGLGHQVQQLVVEEQRDDESHNQQQHGLQDAAPAAHADDPTSAIRPSAPTGCTGRTRNSPTTPAIDTMVWWPGSGVGVALFAGDPLRVGLGLGACLDLALLVGLGLVVVVVDQALGLGLEDPEGATAAPGELGELGRAEQQDR